MAFCATAASSAISREPHAQSPVVLSITVKHIVFTLVPVTFCSAKTPLYSLPSNVIVAYGVPFSTAQLPDIPPETVPSAFNVTFTGLTISVSPPYWLHFVSYLCTITSYVPVILFSEYDVEDVTLALSAEYSYGDATIYPSWFKNSSCTRNWCPSVPSLNLV